MSLFFHIVDKNGKPIFSNVPDEALDEVLNSKVASEVIKSPLIGKKWKRGKAENDKGSVYLLTDDDELLKSSRLFKEKQVLYLEFLDELPKIKEKILLDVLHSPIKLNAHNIQEVHPLLPPDAAFTTYTERIQRVTEKIENDPIFAAGIFLKMAKNTSLLKMQFSNTKLLYGVEPTISPKRYSIRKVLLNTLHIFFEDFSNQNIQINVDECTLTCEFDHDTFVGALFSVIENMTKYVQKNTFVHINFIKSSDWITIRFEMQSLKINDDETDKIFEEGFSGASAMKAEKQGHGLGLSTAVKLLAFNSGRIRLPRDQIRTTLEIGGLRYENNVFEIQLPAN